MHIVHKPDDPAADPTDFETFLALDIRAGTVVEASEFPEARKPAYRLTIDFGAGIGTRKSAAQITEHYTVDDLPGRQVMAVVNFPPRQIGPVRSEVLVLGFPDENGHIVLARPTENIPDGARLS